MTRSYPQVCSSTINELTPQWPKGSDQIFLLSIDQSHSGSVLVIVPFDT